MFSRKHNVSETIYFRPQVKKKGGPYSVVVLKKHWTMDKIQKHDSFK
jgi:hypothetical protein